VIGYCWYLRLGGQMKGLDYSLNKRIDGVDKRIDEVETSIRQLKTNDFAHLNNTINKTIKALTFTLEKNKLLEKEDKEFVDSMLEE